MSSSKGRVKVRTTTLGQMRDRGERIVVVTAYDSCFAGILDEAGADVLLVGDSLGTVVQGRESTVPVLLDDMVYHTSLVSRTAKRPLVVADMPFLTAHFSDDELLRAAGRLLQEGGAEAVKIEGGAALAPRIERLVAAGVPVMGHVGLEPQRFHLLGGHKQQGRSEAAAAKIVDDARAIAGAGAFAMVVEAVPESVAAAVTSAVGVPTIGIGAGPGCSGQVVVLHDLLGLHPPGAHVPGFAKPYAALGAAASEAVRKFAADVRSGAFPVSNEK